jgi:hypothetical protein
MVGAGSIHPVRTLAQCTARVQESCARLSQKIKLLEFLFVYNTFICRSRDSSVGVVTRPRAGRPRNCGSIPGGGKISFSSLKCRGWLWGPPQPPFQRPTSCWNLSWPTLHPWRRRRHIPPKRLLIFNELHGVISQNMVLFDLSVLLEHVPIHQRQHMWFMHGGAPPHFILTVRQHLNQTFGEQWIGREGLVNWPAPSLTLILRISGCGDT